MAEVGRPALSGTALAGMLLAAALAPLGSTMMAVALPAIGRDLEVPVASLTQWLVSSYLITSIVLQSPAGKIGDRIGHRNTITLGLALVAVGGLIGTLLAHRPTLALARILMAAGGAAIVPAAMAILRIRVPADHRARAFGTFGASMSLAAAIGPLVGGELTQRFGWRATFAASIPVVLLALALLPKAEAESGAAARRPAARFDFVGSALLGFGLACLVVASRLGRGGLVLLAIGIALLAVLPFWELRATAPVMDIRLFRNRAFTAGGSVIALQNLAMYALLFQTPLFFDRVRALDARIVGSTLLALTLAMMAASLAAGRLSERIGSRAQVALGSLLALAGLWWFRDFAAIRAPADILPGLTLLGVGLGLSSAPSQASAMGVVGQESAGMAAGALSTMRYLGGVAGIAALGMLVSDGTSPLDHQKTVWIYGAALLGSLMLAPLLPGRKGGGSAAG